MWHPPYVFLSVDSGGENPEQVSSVPSKESREPDASGEERGDHHTGRVPWFQGTTADPDHEV